MEESAECRSILSFVLSINKTFTKSRGIWHQEKIKTKYSEGNIEVYPALLGNYDRPMNQPTDQPTEPTNKLTNGHDGS